MCVCVCVWFGHSPSFKHVLLKNKDTFYLYNFIRFLSSFLSVGVGKFTEIVLSAFGPFIGHRRGLFCMCKDCFSKRILKFFL